MKRACLYALCGLVVIGAAGAQDRPMGTGSYTGTINIDGSIIEMADTARKGQAALEAYARNKAFLLFGSLSKPLLADSDTYEAVVEFTEGRWIGTSRIELFRVFLEVRGDDFAELSKITVGARAIAVVDRPVIKAGPDGQPAVFVRLLSIRLIR